MPMTLYSAPMSSASPVECALRELDVPHELVRLDLSANDQKQPAFLALNPNGKVPTLVVDGTPMFEALAILQWLGDRHGVARRMWPAPDSSLRLRALSFSTWAYVTLGSALQRLSVATSPRSPAALRSAAQGDHVLREVQALLGILDRELGGFPYLLGAEFSLLDLIVASVVRYGTFCGASTQPHRHLTAWLARCVDRPSFQGH